MREIKIRAWANLNGLMLYEGWNGDVFVRKQNIFDLGESANVMEWTGMIDRESKDIYEDDWCEAQFRDSEGIHVLQGRIIMDEYMWCLDCTGTLVRPDIYSINRLHSFYVIGNIYENPELKPI